MNLPKIVILFSGEGSNLLNIIETLHGKELQVVASITNRPNAGGIAKAKTHQVPVEIIDHTHFDSRENFDAKLLEAIESYRPDLVVMAGFMRILTPVFTQNVRSINLHPSMLPLFKGAKAIEQSYENPDKPAGVSVHWVSEELDGGSVIAQQELHRIEGESFESFKNRIHLLEYELLPQTVIDILK